MPEFMDRLCREPRDDAITMVATPVFGVPSGVRVVDDLKRARSLSDGFQRARRVRTTMPTRR